MFSENSNTDINNAFLDALCRNKMPVAIYLRSGIKLSGTILKHDRHTVILKNGQVDLVYKHAISTILPQMAGYR